MSSGDCLNAAVGNALRGVPGVGKSGSRRSPRNATEGVPYRAPMFPQQKLSTAQINLRAAGIVDGPHDALEAGGYNRDMRNSLLACTRFDWSQISPAIFGSLFQGIMEPRERRQIGGHYTSERDILKVVRALFLDDLRAEFQRIKGNKNQLKQFHQKLAAAALPRSGLRLRQLPGHRLPRTAPAGNRGAQGAGRRPASGNWTSKRCRWWTWTPSTASRSASGPRGSPRWRCG